MAKVSSGPPQMQKDPPQGVQVSKNLAPSVFTHYDRKPTGICNKINFDKQIRRADKKAWTICVKSVLDETILYK